MFGLNVVIASDTAERILFTAIPVKITVLFDEPSFFEVRLIIITVRKAPINENSDKEKPPYIPKAAQRVTARPAPEFTPIILGEARRLLSTC